MTNCIFESGTGTSSATICKWCGKEKFMHNQVPDVRKMVEDDVEKEKHPPVFSENGNELFFNEEGNLIKEVVEDDVEKLAEEEYPISKGGSMWMPTSFDLDQSCRQEGFINGYNKAKSTLYTEMQKNEERINNAKIIRDSKLPKQETLYTEEQIKLAYMQGYNRGKDGNPNHMESYIEFIKQSKKD